MARDRYSEDATIPIEYTALDSSLDPLTGLTDLLVSIRRLSDDQFYDWNDDTFKASGWTTRRQAMSEVDATNAPGDYASSFDLSAVTNKAANDTYVVRIEQSPGTTVANVPASGEVEEGLNDIAAGTAMDLVTDAVDANAVATSGAQEIRDAILNDATPFAGANIDAAISSRGTADPGDAMDLIAGAIADIVIAVEARQALVHGAGSWVTAAGFAVPGDEMNLTPSAISSVTAGGGGTDPSSTAAAVEALLSSSHGAGAWITATASIVQQGLQNHGYTLTRAGKLDFIDASILAIPAAVDVALSAAHGAGLWDSGTDPSSVAAEVAGIIIDATGVTTFTLDGALKFMLAKAIGDIQRASNVYVYKDQGGSGLFAMIDNDPVSRTNSIL